MSIKNFHYVLVIIIVGFLVSCSGKSSKPNISYKSYTAQNKSYTVEIPVNFTLYQSAKDYMSFQRQTDRSSEYATLFIKPTDDGFASFDEDLSSNDKYRYSVYKEGDNYKFAECSKGMWSAVQLVMIKNVNGQDYLIQLSTQVSRSSSEEIIRHVYESLKAGVPKTVSTNKQKKEFSTYKSPYLSISYPKGWKCITGVDEMTDAYIAEPNGELTFSIVRFETDASLSEIEEEAKSNSLDAGMRVIKEEKVTINGLQGYKLINEWDNQGQEVKAIGYSFKKSNTFINIKFGAPKKSVERNYDLISSIIQTLKIK